MDVQRAFEILDLNENASEKEIKEHYRDLVSIWHPDRHTHNKRLYLKAEEKMKELNVAYDTICSFLIFKKQYSFVYSETDESENKQNLIIIPCQNCGSNNRIKITQQNYIYTCGKCGEQLFSKSTSESQKDSKERILCGDDMCVGTLGSNGRCNYCGKTISEGIKANERAENKIFINKKRQNEKEEKEKKEAILFVIILLVSTLIIIAYMNN